MNEEVDIHTVENFYGVYLLYCKNPKYLGRTYIGYTVNPNRRIIQHNKGKKAGGAWRTSQRGPWEMVIIIHGFPNDVAALRFEWAWQHPLRSRRLNHVVRKKTKEKNLDYYFRILSEMLVIGPWKRLPLTIRWLNQEFYRDFPIEKIPPTHMPICYGPVISKKIPKNNQLTQESISNVAGSSITSCCSLCHLPFTEVSRKLTCLVSQCTLQSHIICLSKYFLEQNEFLPVRGKCPECGTECLWGDLVKKSQGCYGDVNLEIFTGNADNFYESEDSD